MIDPRVAKYITDQYPAKQVLDVGANRGDTVAQWLELGAGAVHAMEPVPDCYGPLSDRFSNDPRVTVHRMGVSDRLAVGKDLNVKNCWTLLPQESKSLDPALEYRDGTPFDVVFTTIDRLLESTGFEPNLVKIDVDGYELRALRGMRAYMTRRHPPIILEMSYLPEFLGDCCECLVRECMNNGYVIEKLENDGARPGSRYSTARDFMRIFPWDTSFDVLLHPL